MRETKFRGKSDLSIEELEEAGVPHKNGWIVGNLIGDEKLPVIVGPIVDCSDEYFNTEWWASVIPETVGQYTELKDKNDVEIFEGDIVNCTSGCPHEVVHLQEYGGTYIGGMPSWYLSGIKEGYAWTSDEELIGNIHDNLGLLEIAK